VESLCGNCRNPAPRLRLHRLGNRLLCAACFSAIQRARPEPADVRALQQGYRRTILATSGALLAKTLLFLPLFLWARGSDTGAAALRGAVGGDLFGWAALSLVLWPFRRVQVGAGAVFELVLVVLYLQRTTLFEITADIEATAVSVLFFFAVLFAKTGLWAADHILEITGVKESA
jgi:hypothetical protein